MLQRIQLNDPGEYNGQIRLWVNGISTIELYNVSLRNSTDGVVQGMHFQTFFGGKFTLASPKIRTKFSLACLLIIYVCFRILGSTSDWASPQTQKAWFADVSGAVVQS